MGEGRKFAFLAFRLVDSRGEIGGSGYYSTFRWVSEKNCAGRPYQRFLSLNK